MKNQLYKTFLLTLLVVGALIGLFYLPRLSIGETLLRRVNILGDVQQRDSLGRNLAEVAADEQQGVPPEEVLDQSLVQVEEVEVEDSVPDGMVPIEDFASTDGSVRMMDFFYKALRESKNRPVRIAYFGDSFVEGDILTSELRDLFQTRFGGKGVGWVDMQSIVAGFRTTVIHSASGWADHNANDRSGYNASLAGLAGRYYVPAATGMTTLKCQKNFYPQHLASVDEATVYFTDGGSLSLTASLNGGETETLRGSSAMPANPEPVYVTQLVPTDSVDEFGDTVMKEVRVKQEVAAPASDGGSGSGVQAETLRGNISSITVRAHGSGRLYGIALDGTQGVTVDNFAMRSGNGWFLKSLPMETLRQFNALRPYDLIILHYGLNVANKKSKDYTYYTRQMDESIQHLKAAFPTASILVVSVSDRGQKGTDGLMHTMPGVVELMQFQRKMASDNHVAFWNLYEAMGGDGSIARMKEEKQANLDYTHINFNGGKALAKILYDVLINGKENYDRRHP
ncbi:MAG: hypothetical protein K5778_04350 [Bacteroidaceae bacterium]|nr:hypothetical protein [Bacteroidaceae bacterium]MDO4993712.1 hypothetical protein [Bacteroidales bacterium]